MTAYGTVERPDTAAINAACDADTIPDEPECEHTIAVTITREYEGAFYGTRAEAERLAKEYFRRKIGEYEDEIITAEIMEDT